MTLSRSSYICMVMGEVVITFLVQFRFNFANVVNTFKYVLIVILFNVLLLLVLPYNLTWRVLELVNIGLDANGYLF